jgi:hypothetical protein
MRSGNTTPIMCSSLKLIIKIVQVYCVLTWNISLSPILTAETADTTGNDRHKRCGYNNNDVQQLQIDHKDRTAL